MWFFCPRKRPRLRPKWQLLTSGPERIEKVLNSVNYVIRREGERDRCVVHVDRLRRFDEAAETGAVPTGQPTGRRRMGSNGAGISANALPMTSEVVGTPVVAGRSQRLRAIPARVLVCRQLGRTLCSEKETSYEMNYQCSLCPKGIEGAGEAGIV